VAKLIVSRPQIGRFWDPCQRFDVVIDGKPTATIGPGETIEFNVRPGPHRVRAGDSFLQSRHVAIDAGLDETHHLEGGWNRTVQIWFGLPMIACVLLDIGLILWHISLFQRYFPWEIIDSGLPLLMLPAIALTLLPQVAFWVFWRRRFVDLRELPSAALQGRQVTEYPRMRSLRMRITTRLMMVAVAILALMFWAAREAIRFDRAFFFRSRAEYHVDQEVLFRMLDFESVWNQLPVDGPSSGPEIRFARQLSAQAAARADYHAAMRRKYEDAIARGAITVEPDPPEPPWP
jgi:hypothetical protein